jgi:hypothetical protein
MKPVNSKPITIQEYPPQSSTPDPSRPEHNYAPPTANLTVTIPIGKPLIENFPDGIGVRYLSAAPVQDIVISILDSQNRRHWTTSLRTQAGLEWACAFEEKEAKAIKRYFKEGNRFEIEIRSLETLQLSVSLVQFEPQSSQRPGLVESSFKSKAAGN